MGYCKSQCSTYNNANLTVNIQQQKVFNCTCTKQDFFVDLYSFVLNTVRLKLVKVCNAAQGGKTALLSMNEHAYIINKLF